MALDQKIISAWREAASDLGFRLEAPYKFETDDGRTVWVEGHLPDFGGKAGMIFTELDGESYCTNLYQSRLSDCYHWYDRKLFVNTLNDWGWHGAKDNAPQWYTGEPWC